MSSLPNSTQALILNDQGKVEMKTEELPENLESTQILAKMIFAPILPCDRLTIDGSFKSLPLPSNLGVEGVAVVMETEPEVTSLHPGDYVISLYTFPPAGTWQQYCIFDEEKVSKVDVNKISLEKAANVHVNPSTAYGVFNCVKLNPGDVIIQNAANSNLGRQIIKIAHDRGFKTVNVVRKKEKFEQTCEELKKLGADLILDYETLERDGIQNMETPKLGIDAVGGDKFMTLASQVARTGTILSVACISGEWPKIDFWGLVFKSLAIRYFAFHDWVSAEEKRNEVLPLTERPDFPFPEFEKVPWREFDRAIKMAAASGGNLRILWRWIDVIISM